MTRLLGSLGAFDGKGVVRMQVVTAGTGNPDEHVIEATLTPDGDQTVLVVEVRGMPLTQVAGYGSGWQVHVEDLGAYLAGRERCDIKARWDELMPAYEEVAAHAHVGL